MLKIIFALIATILLTLLMSYIKFRSTKKGYCPLWISYITAALWILAFFFALLIELYVTSAAIMLPVFKLFGLTFI